MTFAQNKDETKGLAKVTETMTPQLFAASRRTSTRG
jgi:hypothetical protein